MDLDNLKKIEKPLLPLDCELNMFSSKIGAIINFNRHSWSGRDITWSEGNIFHPGGHEDKLRGNL